MAEYLIQSETLTELADTMRSISNGVPNPCSIEQMKQCLPNIHKTITGTTKATQVANGIEVQVETAYGEITQIAELYRTYGLSGDSLGIETVPYKKINSLVTTEILNHPTGENSVITYKLKGLSQLGYQSDLSSSEDCYSAILYYTDTAGNDNTKYTLHHLGSFNEWSDAYPTYFKFSEIGINPTPITDLMGRFEGIGKFYKDSITGDLDLCINLFGTTRFNSENTGSTFGIAKNGLIVSQIKVMPPESLNIN